MSSDEVNNYSIIVNSPPIPSPEQSKSDEVYFSDSSESIKSCEHSKINPGEIYYSDSDENPETGQLSKAFSEEVYISDSDRSQSPGSRFNESLLNQLQNTAPNQDRQIVTLGESPLTNEQQIACNSLNSVLLAYFLWQNCNGSCKINFLIECMKKAAHSMQTILHSYQGYSEQEKMMVFLREVPRVFRVTIHNDVHANDTANIWLKKAEQDAIKNFLVSCVLNGKTILEDLVNFVKDIFGLKGFPYLGDISAETIKSLTEQYPNDIALSNEFRFYLPADLAVDSNSNHAIDIQTELISFFKIQLSKLEGLRCEALSLILSNKKPQLLERMEDRTPAGILKVLKNSGQFEIVRDFIRLKGQILPQQCTVQQDYQAQGVQTRTTLCCLQGLVVSLTKTKATIWCSSRTVSSFVYLYIDHKETTREKTYCLDMRTVLTNYDEVAFSATSTQKNSHIVWMVKDFKRISNPRNQICVCGKKLCERSPLTQESFNRMDNFLWNLTGVVSAVGSDGCSILCHFDNNKFVQQIIVHCSPDIMVVDCDGNLCKLKCGDKVECDALMKQTASHFKWNGVCVRKVPIHKMVHPNKSLWDCVGTIQALDNRGGKICSNIIVDGIQTKVYTFFDKELLFIMPSDFPGTSLINRLSVNQSVIFDAEPSSSYHKARFIRKSKKRDLPSVQPHQIPLNDDPVEMLRVRDQLAQGAAKAFYEAEAMEVMRAVID